MDRLFGNMMGRQPRQEDSHMNDTAETVYISSLALLKMLKHAKSGIPLEVMGLMVGDKLDDYTIKCIDVFAMPQTGSETTIESIDEVFQADMVQMLRQTGRPESAVGWYHSHPGFGCWLSSTDVNTQKGYEQLDNRWVAVVIDPIQSVRGKIVIDAFRTYGDFLAIGDTENRQSTSNLGTVSKTKLSLKDLSKISYYNLLVDYRKNELETKMLLNIHKSKWDKGFKNKDVKESKENTLKKLDYVNDLCDRYSSFIESEINKSTQEVKMKNVGKFNPKDHLDMNVEEILDENINQCLTSMLNTLVF